MPPAADEGLFHSIHLYSIQLEFRWTGSDNSMWVGKDSFIKMKLISSPTKDE